MRVLLILGLVLLLLGVVSLFVPIPHREHHGVTFGGVSAGFDTTTKEKVHPAVSAVLIGGGVLLILAGRMKR